MVVGGRSPCPRQQGGGVHVLAPQARLACVWGGVLRGCVLAERCIKGGGPGGHARGSKLVASQYSPHRHASPEFGACVLAERCIKGGGPGGRRARQQIGGVPVLAPQARLDCVDVRVRWVVYHREGRAAAKGGGDGEQVPMRATAG